MKNSLLFNLLLVTTAVTAMENPETKISPTQHISLLQSFLHANDFKVSKDDKVTYPHYQDSTQLFVQTRHDAVRLLWDAKDNAAIMKGAGGKLILELHGTLDRSKPLEPQLSDAHKLSLQTFLFHKFFAHEDIDKNDDIVITSKGSQVIRTAQQKHALAEARKSLENFLLLLSDPHREKTLLSLKISVPLSSSFENYLKKAFDATDQIPPWMRDSF